MVVLIPKNRPKFVLSGRTGKKTLKIKEGYVLKIGVSLVLKNRLLVLSVTGWSAAVDC